jgi:hypothetical protein
MKLTRTIVIVMLLIGASLLGTLIVAAGGPEEPDPTTALYMDNQVHIIAANAIQWYRFNYTAGTDANARPLALLKLLNGNKIGVAFELWSPDTITNTVTNKPVGKGATTVIDCGTGLPSDKGQCQTPDLTWGGPLNASGTYFVRVMNSTAAPVPYLLILQGSTVSVLPNPPAAVASPAAVAAAPTATPTAEPAVWQNIDDPNRPRFIDNQQHQLAAHSAVWFRFEYGATNDISDHVNVLIRMVNGNGKGVEFEVYTPERLVEWWKQEPIGRGTASSGEFADLIWKGNFTAAGTYYVRVINDTDFTTTFLLVREDQ